MSVSVSSPRHKRVPSPADARTTDALLESIRCYLNSDGAHVPADSVDTGGMTIIAGGQIYRLELAYEGLQDETDWQRLMDLRFTTWVACEEARPAADIDWMSDTGGDIPF